MIYLPYLRENTAKIRENWRLNPAARPTSGLFNVCVPPAQESAPGNVKAGRDLHEYCTPDTGGVIIVCSSTGV